MGLTVVCSQSLVLDMWQDFDLDPYTFAYRRHDRPAGHHTNAWAVSDVEVILLCVGGGRGRNINVAGQG